MPKRRRCTGCRQPTASYFECAACEGAVGDCCGYWGCNSCGALFCESCFDGRDDERCAICASDDEDEEPPAAAVWALLKMGLPAAVCCACVRAMCVRGIPGDLQSVSKRWP